MQIEGQPNEESNAYSLFLYAVRLPVTRDYYLRRLCTFFNHIGLLVNGTMQERCNLFAAKGIRDPNLDPIVTTSPHFPRWIGIDPGYASSQFGITIVQYKDQKLEVVYNNSLVKPLYTDTLNLVR